MPVLYKQIPLFHSGMISAERFELPGDGRKVFFDISPGGTFRKEIFIVMDGKLKEDAFVNGSRLETPVRGFERLMASPHEAFAVVVERTEQPIAPIAIPITPIPVTFPDGRNSAVKLSGTLRATIFPENPARLAQDYADGVVSTPEEAAAGALKGALVRALTRGIPAIMKRGLPNDVLGWMDAFSLEAARLAAEETQRVLPWCRVPVCEVELTVQNLDQLLAESNSVYNLRVETQRKLLDAVIATFGNSPLPAEVSQVILAYVQANPGLPAGDIKDFCQGIHDIWQHTSPSALLNAARQVGLLPAGNGGS